MDLITSATVLVTLLCGLALGIVVGRALAAGNARDRAVRERADSELVSRTAAQTEVVRDGLDRLARQMESLEGQRVSWQAELRQQVDGVRHSTDLLRRETSSLSNALRKPQVRGRWGELHLRRAVELAGLVDRCDFSEQMSLAADGSTSRPDLVVRLAGGRHVVVDAKVPLDAFLDATETDDEDERAAHLARHARQLRQHVDSLAAKAYWRLLPSTPEFVVLFVPGESFLSAALESEASLLEYAFERRVILATPTTLIALLRTVAVSWREEALSERAQEIHSLGVELHERLGTLGGHVDRLGRSLTAGVAAYNQLVGCLETRVLVSARRFTALDAVTDELPTLQPLDVTPRPPTALELVEDQRSGAHAAPRDDTPLGVATEGTA